MNATAASLPTEPLTIATALKGMANTVLLIGEWLVQQQQQLAIQQRLLEEKQSNRWRFTRVLREAELVRGKPDVAKPRIFCGTRLGSPDFSSEWRTRLG